MYRFHRSLKIMIIDNILVDWQSSKKVISFPTLVISFVRSYQFSDTCHSNNSSHISDQCGQKKFIYFCWPIIFYSWYIFWYHMGLGTSKNIIIYLWFTLNVMYPNEACYTYQFCEIFSKWWQCWCCFCQTLGLVLRLRVDFVLPLSQEEEEQQEEQEQEPPTKIYQMGVY